MKYAFTSQRLSEFQDLYVKHCGTEISEKEAEQKLIALVAMLIICSNESIGGRHSNAALDNCIKNTNE